MIRLMATHVGVLYSTSLDIEGSLARRHRNHLRSFDIPRLEWLKGQTHYQ